MKETRVCSIPECNNIFYQKTFCSRHYRLQRVRKPLTESQKVSSRQRSNQYYKENKDTVKVKSKENHLKNKSERNRKNREYWRRNREVNIRISCEYYKKHRDSIYPRLREYAKRYRQQHKDRYNYLAAKRRAAKLLRTPPWLEQRHFDQIASVYSACPAGYNVDHIVPLQGKNVSGLHVPWNLRVITASDNFKKLNKFDPAQYRVDYLKELVHD